MLGLGKIEILDASYSLGMCGSIEFRINATSRIYKIIFGMQDGLREKHSDDGGGHFTSWRGIDEDQLIALLPEYAGWTYATFIACWAGFAAGMERGRDKEMERQYILQRQAAEEQRERMMCNGT